MRLKLAFFSMLSVSAPAPAEPFALEPRVGDVYEIRLESISSSQSDDGSSGSSTDRNTLIERVLGVSDDGIELEFDLPEEASAQERSGVWQLPVRVLKPIRGHLQLLNGNELEQRVDPWLEKAGYTRAACGRWIFTWNAFRIDCDPQSALDMLVPFDLRLNALREGDLYEDPAAEGSARLTKRVGTDGMIFEAEMPIAPEAVRRAQAETDVVVAEIMGRPKSFDDALRERVAEEVSGTMTVTFETDSAGFVKRRTKVVTLQIRSADDRAETRTTTETLKRTQIARLSS